MLPPLMGDFHVAEVYLVKRSGVSEHFCVATYHLGNCCAFQGGVRVQT